MPDGSAVRAAKASMITTRKVRRAVVLGIVAVFAAGLAVPVLSAQTANNAKQNLAGWNYTELVENAPATKKGLPLIIVLHSSGSSPADFAQYISGFTKPVRILLLEGNYTNEKGGFSFFVRSPRSYYKDLTDDERKEHLLTVAENVSRFITAATKKYAPSKAPVIIGASQGGDISYVIAVKYGKLISHSFPLLATIDDRIIRGGCPTKVVGIDIFHGTADPIVSLSDVMTHASEAETAGFRVKVHKYEGVKHDISPEMKADYQALIAKVLF
ncbi:MAG: hypothetical protein DCC44_03710 [Acidobacteria bacterium]|nr:MAG: hypothetical protein DCC44_03710 [Acidobacteriota bacterium]